jgi:hypothetical protein
MVHADLAASRPEKVLVSVSWIIGGIEGSRSKNLASNHTVVMGYKGFAANRRRRYLSQEIGPTLIRD